MDFKALTEATSGAVGGLLSTTLLYPLDTCKTKFQAESCVDGENRYRNLTDVLREAITEGKILSLYQGLSVKNVHSVVSGFVYFYSYSFIRTQYLKAYNLEKMGTGANLLVAAAAGACTCIATQPWDTISARMQTSRPDEFKGLFDILKEGGIRNAFDGLGASLFLTCNPAIQYTVFEQCKEYLLRSKKEGTDDGLPVALSAFSAFLLGAFSKTVATILTYPAIRCKVLMQRAETVEEKGRRLIGDKSAGPPKSMLQALRIIWNGEGVRGFYKGLHAQILKTVIASALMLMVKEKVGQGTALVMLSLRRSMARRQGGKAQSSRVKEKKVPQHINTSSTSKLSSTIHQVGKLPLLIPISTEVVEL